MEWQPIETAPYGTDCLVCVTHSLGQGEWETVQWVDAYTDVYGWGLYPHMPWVPFPPTHWMPLPEPPK
jgi:hypothetical protein